MAQVEVTANNRGPLINLATWITLCAMVLAVLTKVVSKFSKLGVIKIDDYIMAAAMIFSVGQSIATSEQVAFGLGQHQDTLSNDQIEGFEKSAYASSVLYIVSLALAKMTTLHFLETLARTSMRRIITRSFMALDVAWASIAVVALLFQCSVPQTWAVLSTHCFKQSPFWDVIGAVDILIDCAIIGLPIYLLYDLQLPIRKRISTMAAFAFRAMMIPLTVTRLVFIAQAVSSTDRTYDDFNTVLISQIIINVSIIVACVPFLKPFMESLQVGFIVGGVHALNPRGHQDSDYAMGSVQLKSPRGQSVMSGDAFSRDSRQWIKIHDTVAQTMTTATTDRDVQMIRDLSGFGAAGGNKMAIRQTTDMTVQYEDRESVGTSSEAFSTK